VKYLIILLDILSKVYAKNLCVLTVSIYILLLKDDQTDHNYVKDTNFTYFVNRRKLKIVSLAVSNIIQELEKIFKQLLL